MAPTDSSVSLAPNRRTSLRPRPVTACGFPSQEPTYSNRRHSALLLMPTTHRHDSHEPQAGTPSLQARPETMATPPHLRSFAFPAGEASIPNFELYSPSAPTHNSRRSPSFSHSLRQGVNELRSLGRRMSLSMRNRNGKNKQTMIQNWQDSMLPPDAFDHDPWQESPAKGKAKTWFRSQSAKRRPSLPLLSHTGSSLEPPAYTIHSPVPGSRHGPPLLPNDLQSGAGARAAAAAQNEALQSTHRLTTITTLEHITSRTTSMKLTRDSESGIGIDINNRPSSVGSSIDVTRIDPLQYLATELMDQVLCFLDPSSLLRAERVSSKWSVQARSKAVWRHVFRREFHGRLAESIMSSSAARKTAIGLGKPGTPDQEWRKMYLVRRAIDQRWDKGEAAAIYLNGHKDSVYCVQFDEHKIITGSRDQTIRVWNTHTYQCIQKIGPPSDPAERQAYELELLKPQDPYPLHSINSSSPDPSGGHAPTDYHSASILCLQFDHEILVTGSSDFTCIVWSIKDDYKPLYRLRGHSQGVLDVCIDERHIITCSKDTTIIVWDRRSGKLLKRLHGHRGPVNAVQMRGNLLASASGDGMSKLWNLDAGVCIKEFSSRDRGLACVEFSEDGRTIFAGGNDQVIYEYDTNTGKVVRQLRGHRNLVRSLHLDTSNNRIISGSYDMSVKVWDAKEGTSSSDGGLKINFEGWTTSWMLAAKSDYRKIVCTSQDGRVVIIDFAYGLEGANLLET